MERRLMGSGTFEPRDPVALAERACSDLIRAINRARTFYATEIDVSFARDDEGRIIGVVVGKRTTKD
jgi:hypothetical protein